MPSFQSSNKPTHSIAPLLSRNVETNSSSQSFRLPTKRACYSATPRQPLYGRSRSYRNEEEEEEVEIDEVSAMGGDNTESSPSTSSSGFVSARNQYITDQQKKFGKSYNPNNDRYVYDFFQIVSTISLLILTTNFVVR